MLRFTRLPLFSYLKVDDSYEIPILAVEEIADEYSNQPTLPLKGEGEIRHLQDYLRRLKYPRQWTEFSIQDENAQPADPNSLKFTQDYTDRAMNQRDPSCFWSHRQRVELNTSKRVIRQQYSDTTSKCNTILVFDNFTTGQRGAFIAHVEV